MGLELSWCVERSESATCGQPLKFEKVMKVAGVELGPSQRCGDFPDETLALSLIHI